MSDFSNELTPAQAERLAMLIEDCAEIQHIACKILRHGYESYDPTKEGSPTNREHLGTEIGQLLATVSHMDASLDVSSADVANGESERNRTWGAYMHHQD